MLDASCSSIFLGAFLLPHVQLRHSMRSNEGFRAHT